MGRRKYDYMGMGKDFNNFDRGCHRGHRSYHGHGGLFSMVDMFVNMMMFGINLAIGIVSIFFKIFEAFFSGGRNMNRPEVNRPDVGSFNANKGFNQGPSNGSDMPPKDFTSQYSKQEKANEPKQTVNNSKTAEMKKDTAKEDDKKTAHNENHTSDWNIVIFIFMLIPGIITLAIGRFAYTAGIVAVGVALMLIYNIGRKISSSSKQKKEEKAQAEEETVEETSHEKLIRDAFEKVFDIRTELYRVSNPEVKEKVEKLCGMAEKIIGEVRTNPACLKQVNKFFYYYLDAFGEIFTKYLRLSNFTDSSAEIEKVVDDTEISFDDMGKIFNEMCSAMVESDMMNLKAEINVMKNSN